MNQQHNGANDDPILTLREAATRFNLSDATLDRLRRLLDGRHVRPRLEWHLRFRLSDIERAIRVDRANQAARAVLDVPLEATRPCPRCGADVPRLWFVDRCENCGRAFGRKR